VAVPNRFSRLFRATFGALLAILAVAGCGGEIKVDEADRTGAQLFYERCSGCHSLQVANSYGSKAAGQLKAGERTNGPNFNVRKEPKDDVLFAIRNGGYSGAIMPANIVVGKEAEAVADFLAKYSGSKRGQPSDAVSPGQGTGSGSGP
jgi:mono/diheme cytochrome c family protein